jgi:hypothetical protein
MIQRGETLACSGACLDRLRTRSGGLGVACGPEAAAGRAMLRLDFSGTFDEVRGRPKRDKAFIAVDFAEALVNRKRRRADLDSPAPLEQELS